MIAANGKAVPYGVYDIAANEGWVSVGLDHDTAAFAVESIRRWWHRMGRKRHPRARRLLITADCACPERSRRGGSTAPACASGKSNCRSSPTRPA
jgi:hypothetical protein